MGTIHADSKDLPADVKKKEFKKMKKGERIVYMNKEQMVWLYSGEIKKMFP